MNKISFKFTAKELFILNDNIEVVKTFAGDDKFVQRMIAFHLIQIRAKLQMKCFLPKAKNNTLSMTYAEAAAFARTASGQLNLFSASGQVIVRDMIMTIDQKLT